MTAKGLSSPVLAGAQRGNGILGSGVRGQVITAQSFHRDDVACPEQNAGDIQGGWARQSRDSGSVTTP